MSFIKKIVKKEKQGISLRDYFRLTRTSKQIKDRMIFAKQNLTPIKKISAPCDVSSIVDLDAKVNAFITWYYNIINKSSTPVGKYLRPRELKDFIEKMAVWFELRYPYVYMEKLVEEQERKKRCRNNVVYVDFNKEGENPYDVFSSLRLHIRTREYNPKEWEDMIFISGLNELGYQDATKEFILSLSEREKSFFGISSDSIAYLDQERKHAHLHISQNGIVIQSEYMNTFTLGAVKDEELEGLHIRQVYELFQKIGLELPKSCEIERVMRSIETKEMLREGMLDCVMYRIIERGGNRIGPRRAFLFAREFRRNIDIPMMYAADTSDPNLREFINEYLKAGGHTDLTCYENYFCRASKWDQVSKITVAELLSIKQSFTKEEQELHERLVNVLASGINQTELQHEEVMRLRLKRGLEKSKKESDS